MKKTYPRKYIEDIEAACILCGVLKTTRCDSLGSGKCGSCAAKTRRKSDPLVEKKAKVNKRKYIETSCIDCGEVKMRRYDAVWHGRCRSCSSKENAKLPHVKEQMRINGMNHPPPRQNVKNLRRGQDSHFWRGGITPANMKTRLSKETRDWRKAVLARDNFTCKMCNKRGGDLEVDHIQPFSLFPELRFDLNNGRTLCVQCHRKYGARVFKGKITREAVLTPQS